MNENTEYDATDVAEQRPVMIADMAADDRPREKALRLGVKALTNAELMALLFATGIKGKSVLRLSDEILADQENHLSQIARMSIRAFLKRYKGIGPAKAITLFAALELGSRCAADAASMEAQFITDSKSVAAFMRHHVDHLPYEEFWILLLARNGKVIAPLNVSRGGVASTVVDVRIILRHAIENLASSIVLCHNHPSGTLFPSRQDDDITVKIRDAAKLLDIRVLDHIILTDSDFYSYHDNGHIL